MSTYNRVPKLILSPLRLHSASSVHLPNNNSTFLRHTPSIRLSPLKLHSAQSFYIPRTNFNSPAVFRNNLRIRLSPLTNTILKKYKIKHTNFPQRCRGYRSINKCNAKRCGCCNHLSHRSTITSNVNGRTFNVVLNSDVD
jgi:hypothetical protein